MNNWQDNYEDDDWSEKQVDTAHPVEAAGILALLAIGIILLGLPIAFFVMFVFWLMG
jgi:hypothetical protein